MNFIAIVCGVTRTDAQNLWCMAYTLRQIAGTSGTEIKHSRNKKDQSSIKIINSFKYFVINTVNFFIVYNKSYASAYIYATTFTCVRLQEQNTVNTSNKLLESSQSDAPFSHSLHFLLRTSETARHAFINT